MIVSACHGAFSLVFFFFREIPHNLGVWSKKLSKALHPDPYLGEHASVNTKRLYDESISTFFRNVDPRTSPPRDLPVGDGRSPIATLRARAVLVDMEEGVINSLLHGPLQEVKSEY